MGFTKEFREFAIKGSVIDLAIAVVLGAAFGRIITAFSASIIMPLISLVLGKSSVAELTFIIGNTYFPVGLLLQAIIDFVLVALVLFSIIRTINKMNREKEAPAAEPTAPEFSLQEKLLMEIRDSLKR